MKWKSRRNIRIEETYKVENKKYRQWKIKKIKKDQKSRTRDRRRVEKHKN